MKKHLAGWSISLSLLLSLILAPCAHGASPRHETTPQSPSGGGLGSGWSVISVASLTPFEDGYDYVTINHWFSHLHGPENSTNNGWYMAPVYLPDGAIITRLSVYWKKTGDTAEGLVRLQRSQLGVGNYQELAIVDSSASTSGTFVERDDTISYDEVINTQYAYWLVYDLPADADLQAGSAIIQYIPPLASQTGVLTIPAAAFHPRNETYDYKNHARYLYAAGVEGSDTDAKFYTPVTLPDGAEITSFTYYWYSTSTIKTTKAYLSRFTLDESLSSGMVNAASADGGYGATQDTTIEFATIDNTSHEYYLWIFLPFSSDTRACGVVIHYNLPEETPANLFTVSASAFQPAWDGYSYTNIGHRLIHTNTGGDPINGDYIAPVQLPSGVSITKISFFWENSQPGASGRAWLYRGDLDGSHTALASVLTGAPEDTIPTETTTINFPKIDNTNYVYWLTWSLPPKGSGDDVFISGCGMIIDYAYRTYLPLQTVDASP